MPIRIRKHSESNTSPTKVEREPAKSKYTLKEILGSRWLRLTHLYYIKNELGQKVLFKPKPEQAEFLSEMSNRNVILKARQLGFTTAIQIFFLDACLFNNNVSAGVIAHNREDAQAFFDDKIKFAYDNLPDAIKASRPAINDSAGELRFPNIGEEGSSKIRVGSSMRSGTFQYLHVSEYGKLCAKRPDQAEEVRTGSLNTVASDCVIIIESTAEGAHGHFHDICVRSEQRELEGTPMTALDYKFFFYAWHREPRYRLHPKHVHVSREMEDYFLELERDHDISLDPEQKAWYVKKQEEQGDYKMTREYPSYPAEAFRGITEGAVFGKQMRQARIERRIIEMGYVSTEQVYTFWDIGRDMTSIWFMQQVGPQSRFIDFYQEENRDLAYFARLLLQDRSKRFHRFNYARHYFPHDMGNTDYSVSDQQTRAEVARGLGLHPYTIVPRIAAIEDGIEMARQALSSCFFCKKHADEGIISLENYRYERNEKLETWSTKPLHNAASHGADAFRQYAQGFRTTKYADSMKNNPLSRVYRRRQQVNQTDWRT